MRRFLVVLATVVLTFSSALAQRNDPPIEQMRQDWAKALETKDIVGSMVLYDQDAEFLNPDGTHASGVKEIGRLFESMFKQFDAQIKMTSRGSGWSEGGYAYDSGSFEETLVDRKTKVSKQFHGDYLTVYNCSNASRCLIIRQAWTGAMPQ